MRSRHRPGRCCSPGRASTVRRRRPRGGPGARRGRTSRRRGPRGGGDDDQEDRAVGEPRVGLGRRERPREDGRREGEDGGGEDGNVPITTATIAATKRAKRREASGTRHPGHRAERIPESQGQDGGPPSSTSRGSAGDGGHGVAPFPAHVARRCTARPWITPSSCCHHHVPPGEGVVSSSPSERPGASGERVERCAGRREWFSLQLAVHPVAPAVRPHGPADAHALPVVEADRLAVKPRPRLSPRSGPPNPSSTTTASAPLSAATDRRRPKRTSPFKVRHSPAVASWLAAAGTREARASARLPAARAAPCLKPVVPDPSWRRGRGPPRSASR